MRSGSLCFRELLEGFDASCSLARLVSLSEEELYGLVLGNRGRCFFTAERHLNREVETETKRQFGTLDNREKKKREDISCEEIFHSWATETPEIKFGNEKSVQL